MSNTELKEKCEQLEKEKKQILKRSDEICRELISLRTNCKHITDDGKDACIYHSTDLRKDFYKCTICGHIKKK